MKFIADFHTHSISSGHAYNTIYEYAHYAKEKGLKVIAITDHGPKMGGGPHKYFFENLRMLPNEINGVRILKGIEANILNEKGALDLSNETLGDLDIVLASFHRNLGYSGRSKKKNTEALLKVIKNPHVRVIAHPGNPQFKVDLKTIVSACKEYGVLLEINNNSFAGFVRVGSYDVCLEIAKEVKRIGWKVVFGSDAHCVYQLGLFDNSIKLANEAGLSESDIVNSSMEMVEEYILK